MNKIDLNINNSKELINNCPDYNLINEGYLEWRISDWKAIKPGKLYYSPVFKIGDSVW